MTTTQTQPPARCCSARNSVKTGPRPRKGIDLRLSILAAIRKPGVTYSQGEIAQFCGCAPQNIARIEKTAMARLERHPVVASILKEFFPA